MKVKKLRLPKFQKKNIETKKIGNKKRTKYKEDIKKVFLYQGLLYI